MVRLIDADALEKEIYKWMPKDQETWMDSGIPPIENLVVSIMMTIQEQPTVDAVPVVHARWEWVQYSANCGNYHCTNCRYIPSDQMRRKYCASCGAKMDGERREE